MTNTATLITGFGPSPRTAEMYSDGHTEHTVSSISMDATASLEGNTKLTELKNSAATICGGAIF